MVIEYTNAKAPKSHSFVAVAFVACATIFFFIPTTLIILGYYSSQPTGGLLSPLPEGVLSEMQAAQDSLAQITPAPMQEIPTPLPTQAVLIADSNTSMTPASASAASGNNMLEKTATMSAGLYQAAVEDIDVHPNTQIFLAPRTGDNTIYFVSSKGDGLFIISANQKADTLRYIDYKLVNP